MNTKQEDIRKHIRVCHNGEIRLSTEDKPFDGKSIDISNSGMQVLADIPQAPFSVRKISFNLPQLKVPIEIPCRLARINNSGNCKKIMGIEFLYESEDQADFVDNYVREVKKTELSNEKYSYEYREIPRIPCQINDVLCNNKDITNISINNISTEGISIDFEGDLNRLDILNFEFLFPGDSRKLNAKGLVKYTLENNFNGRKKSAGIVFTELDEINSARIRNFINNLASSFSIKAVQELSLSDEIDKKYQITDKKKKDLIFRLLIEEKILMKLLFQNEHKVIERELIDIDLQKDTFKTSVYEGGSSIKIGDNVFFSFLLKNDNYFFNTTIKNVSRTELNFILPDVIIKSENRSGQRISPDWDKNVFFEFRDTKTRKKGNLVDFSRRGFLCEFPYEDNYEEIYKVGKKVSFCLNKHLGFYTYGQVCHVNPTEGPGREKMLHVGIETGIERSNYTLKKISDEEWRKKKLYPNTTKRKSWEKIRPELVTYTDEAGREIKGLINYTRKGVTAPVVILPSAFGKKKEALSPLVATLINNFKLLKKDIATIRFDGINRGGESHNEEVCPRRGYEMQHYRIGQSLDDLRTTIRYVNDNPFVKPSKIILVTFSMSSLDARKIMIMPGISEKIEYWISVMGVTAAKSAMRNILGGVDLIGNHLMGIPNGFASLMGHFLDLDTLTRDLIDLNYAYLTDARLDMSRINKPTTWIYGKHDRWVVSEEINDIMSVASNSMREVIEIPTGHNLHTSEDALKAFGLITELILKNLFNKTVKAQEPAREQVVDIITYERERIRMPEKVEANRYWKEYLIGTEEDSVGYDFYKNIKEFKDFLSVESELIDLKNEEIIADMGCGTGIFIENLLRDCKERGVKIKDSQFFLIDLVPEALEKTKRKCDRLKAEYNGFIPPNISYMSMNLEPNRLIPVKQFIEDPNHDLSFLRDKVEGLTSSMLDNFLRNGIGNLSQVIRGNRMTLKDLSVLKKEFREDEVQVISDLNLAARFLGKKITVSDIQKEKRSKYGNKINLEDYKQLRTSDLGFKKLNLGDNGLDLYLNFKDNFFDKIVASLFISYLFNPFEMIRDFYRILKVGGKLLVSSMVPDSDISLIFTNYIDRVQHFDLKEMEIKNRDMNLAQARMMLNKAATLMELEGEGYFKFYTGNELAGMFEMAGFKNIQVSYSLGRPEQAVIVVGEK